MIGSVDKIVQSQEDKLLMLELGLLTNRLVWAIPHAGATEEPRHHYKVPQLKLLQYSNGVMDRFGGAGHDFLARVNS